MCTTETDYAKSGHLFDIKCIWDSWKESDGSLVMRVNEEPVIYIRMLSWEQGLTWGMHYGWVNRGAAGEIGWSWYKNDHGVELLNSERLYRNSDVLDYLSEIPLEILKNVARYGLNQWLMLSLLARYPGATDLMDSNPNLLFLLAWSIQNKVIVENDMAGLIVLKQRDILHHLLKHNFVQSDVRLLRKIQVANGDSEFLKEIISLFSTSRRRELFRHHWPVIPQQALASVLKWESLVFSRCLGKELIGLSSAEVNVVLQKVSTTWKELGAQEKMLSGFVNMSERILSLTSYQKMLRLHDWCTGQINRMEMVDLRDMKHQVFPEPPFAETEIIQPILSTTVLHQESQLMRHCVSSYWRFALYGDCAYYKVLSPERGTLELRLDEEGWGIGEFKLAENEEPSEKSWKAVQEWLDAMLRTKENEMELCQT